MKRHSPYIQQGRVTGMFFTWPLCQGNAWLGWAFIAFLVLPLFTATRRGNNYSHRCQCVCVYLPALCPFRGRIYTHYKELHIRGHKIHTHTHRHTGVYILSHTHHPEGRMCEWQLICLPTPGPQDCVPDWLPDWQPGWLTAWLTDRFTEGKAD